MWLVGGMNGVSDASGMKYETPRPAGGATATVRRPAFVTRGETSEPGSLKGISVSEHPESNYHPRSFASRQLTAAASFNSIGEPS